MLGCPQPVTPRRTAGHTGQPGSRTAGHTGQPDIPGSRAAGQPGIPDSRTYRAAGHTGQPDSRIYRAAGHTGQPDSRTAGHTGQPGIPDSRAYRAAGQPEIPHPHAHSPTSLAADTAGAADNLAFVFSAASCRRAPRSSAPASGAAEACVGRSLSPSVVRPCAWHAGSTAAWGPDRAAVAWGALHRCVGRAPSVAWGAAGRTWYACRYRRAHARQLWWAPARRPAAQPAAQPRSQQTPLARPQTWAFFRAPLRADARLALHKLPAALLKRVVGLPATRNALDRQALRADRFRSWQGYCLHIPNKPAIMQIDCNHGGS